MTFIDIIFIVCISINMFIGYIKGFIWTVVGLSSYLIAALFSKLLYKELASWIINYTGIYSRLEEFIEVNFYTLFPSNITNGVELSEEITNGTGVLGDFLIKNVDIQNYAYQTFDVIKNDLIHSVVELLINVISVVLIFMVVKAIVLVLGRGIEQVFKLPILNSLNKTGGLVIGGVKGFILVMATIMIMFVFSVISPSGRLAIGIENSLILNFFFSNLFPNLLNWLL